MKMNPKIRKTCIVLDEQSLPDNSSLVHLVDDETGDGENIGKCCSREGEFAYVFDKVDCINCLWRVMQDGQHAQDRLQYLQNLAR